MPLRHIQIVDNDPTAALVTQRGLQALLKTEADIVVAPSPDAAWLYCLHEPVDLIIIDPNPQSRAATGLVKVLRNYRPEIAVLVLTAYDSPLLRSQMRSLGIQHYIAKPVDLHDLEQTVRMVLETHPVAHPDSPDAEGMDAAHLVSKS